MLAGVLIYLLLGFVCECYEVFVPTWARALHERDLQTAEMGKKGGMRPEGALKRTLERMEDVVIDRRLNLFINSRSLASATRSIYAPT